LARTTLLTVMMVVVSVSSLLSQGGHSHVITMGVRDPP